MNGLIKTVFTLATFVFGLGVAWLLKSHSPEAVQQAKVPQLQIVAIKPVEPETVSIPVFSRGEVSPSTEIQLVLEVAGQVTYVSPNFANGGYFRSGEVLLRVDKSRYELDLTKAQSRVVSAKQKYRRTELELSLDDEVTGLPSPKRYHQRQLAELEAQIEAAEADLKWVKMQLKKTELRAPFDGRVRQVMIGTGQYVSPGARLAQVYPVDRAEVRLPLSDRQLAILDLPTISRNNKNAPEVTFSLRYGDRPFTWAGHIVRTESGLDARNRLLYVVAQIHRPYDRDVTQPGRPSLSSGQFLEAEIMGKDHHDIVVLPRRALRNGTEVWVVKDSKLSRRDVSILHKTQDQVFVSDGLVQGEQVVMTPLEVAIEGMRVDTVDYDEQSITNLGTPALNSTQTLKRAG